MKAKLFLLIVGLALGFGLGFFQGKRSSDADWSKRTVAGLAVDCYDSSGKLVGDKGYWAQFPATACAPGQTARLHNPTPVTVIGKVTDPQINQIELTNGVRVPCFFDGPTRDDLVVVSSTEAGKCHDTGIPAPR